jgi:hypothetical protein
MQYVQYNQTLGSLIEDPLLGYVFGDDKFNIGQVWSDGISCPDFLDNSLSPHSCSNRIAGTEGFDKSAITNLSRAVSKKNKTACHSFKLLV